MFISIERFQSLTDETKLLRCPSGAMRLRSRRGATSSIIAPRRSAGREGVFRDYRLRIASVVRDYGITERAEAPANLRATNG